MITFNSGHSLWKSGYTIQGVKESDIAIKIKNYLQKFIPHAYYVDDNLDLRNSIKFVNSVNSDMAVSIHLNSNKNTSVSGVECYYKTDPKIASIFTKHIARVLDIPDRGARHQSESYYKSLAWLNQVNCQSFLIEVCYLSNTSDRRKILINSNQLKVAQAISNAVKEIQMSKRKLLAIEVTLREIRLQLKKMLSSLKRID